MAIKQLCAGGMESENTDKGTDKGTGTCLKHKILSLVVTKVITLILNTQKGRNESSLFFYYRHVAILCLCLQTGPCPFCL